MRNTDRIYGTIAAVFLLAGSLTNAVSAAIPCRSYDVRDGLSENSVRCIMQDRKGYMWFGTKDGLSRYNGREFKVYGNRSDARQLNVEFLIEHTDGDKVWIASRNSLELLDVETGRLTQKDLSKFGICKSFRTLCYDSEGRLWVGSNEGLAVIGPAHGTDAAEYEVVAVYKHVEGDPRTLPSDNVGSLLCDRGGNVWIGTENGIVRQPKGSDTLVPVDTGSGRREHFLCISEDENGIIWAGTWDDGMYSINPKDGSVHNYLSPYGEKKNAVPLIRWLHHNDRATIIICSNSGLFEYDRNTGKLKRMELSEGLPNDSFYSCLKDHEGGLWIGTYFNGVLYISPKAAEIELYRPDPNSPLSGTAVSEFCRCGKDRLWVGTENGGLSLLDRTTGKFVPIRWHDNNDNIHALCQKGEDLWVATFSSGLKRINLRTGAVSRYYMTQGNVPDSENAVYSLYHSEKDGRDCLYVGTKRGCSVYDYKTGTMTPVPELEGYMIYDILEDYTGKMWFSCHGYGLYCHDRYTGQWKRYRCNPEDKGSLCSDRIIDIYSDAKGQLWLCSEGNGVCRYDYGTDSFVVPPVASPDGKLPSSVIFGILDDSCGHLWMSSNAGIIRLDPKTGDYRLYTYEDGLQSNQFNFKSSFKTDDGKFWFGGVDGFNAFFPEDIKDNSVAPRVTASVRYHGQTFFGKDVTIPSGIGNFSIDFDCLSYVSPQKTVFEYRFDKDADWTKTGQASVSFADLKPGKYTFLLRAVNSDGYVSVDDCAIRLKINEPWYRSIAAICLYVLLLAAATAFGVYTYLKIRSKEEARRIEDMKLRNEKESYNAKIQFFTQIAHEIKTPVTLIKAPLEIVMEHRTWDSETEENLGIIEANTTRLAELTNQLLDFKKISNEGYLLHLTAVNLISVIEDVLRRFRTPSGKAVDITFSSADKGKGYFGMFDPDAVSKILSNLVENAVKYTKDKIEVELHDETGHDGQQMLMLSVSNNGPAIPKEEARKIFDTFYQVDNGSGKDRKPGFGIGLSLVSLLADKSGGRAYVDTDCTDGCRFCVELPWVKADSTEALPQEEEAEVKSTVSEQESKITLLVVEDNTDILSFIAGQLKSSFRILKATDGKKAIAKLEKHNVDIIVSDIAMPNMDGFELLKEVRENPMTSHIPFVLLSAESSVESKIRGLDSGADAYIEKPFSISHFKAVIDSIINNRKVLMEKFASSPEESLNFSKYGTLDIEWLSKADAIIGANLSSIDFSVQQLADGMFVSRSNLQRKMKSLTGMAPNEYIKLFRLKKAAGLLISDNYRINEVCYMCGFNTPSYFTSCFFKQFGILPKEFVALHKAQSEEGQSCPAADGRGSETTPPPVQK